MGDEVAAVGIPHQISIVDGALASTRVPASGRQIQRGWSVPCLHGGHHRPLGEVKERSGSVEVLSLSLPM